MSGKKKVEKTPEVKKFTQELVELDAWTMLLSTIRYSFGRRTYMSSLAWELVIRYESYLNSHQLNQIASEIEEELERHHKHGQDMGDPCDVASWEMGAKRVREILAERRAKLNGASCRSCGRNGEEAPLFVQNDGWLCRNCQLSGKEPV
jgi:formylmethanofuran dehydrogenase subunit E